jgi:predicted RNase H-like HicB family nuclease
MSIVSEMHTKSVEADAATYTATFELGEDGWWAAQVVEVPEAISQGRTLDEARANVADALALALDLRVREGREIPSAGRVAIASVTPAR